MLNGYISGQKSTTNEKILKIIGEEVPINTESYTSIFIKIPNYPLWSLILQKKWLRSLSR